MWAVSALLLAQVGAGRWLHREGQKQGPLGWGAGRPLQASLRAPHPVTPRLSSRVPQGAVIAKKVSWVGCQGSESHLRGFPCSLWLLFHFLTVQATRPELNRSQEPGETTLGSAPCPSARVRGWGRLRRGRGAAAGRRLLESSGSPATLLGLIPARR